MEENAGELARIVLGKVGDAVRNLVGRLWEALFLDRTLSVYDDMVPYLAIAVFVAIAVMLALFVHIGRKIARLDAEIEEWS